MRELAPDAYILLRGPGSAGLLVGIAQLVERCVVVADVAGSSPVTHPRAVEPQVLPDLRLAASPALAVSIRRMHDQDRSGWWILCPIANIIFLFIDGTPGPNRFGPDPKGRG